MLHRDLLLPCGLLILSEESVPDPEKISKPRTQSQSKKELLNDEQSDSDDEIYLFSRVSARGTRITYAYDITKPKVADGNGKKDVPQKPDSGKNYLRL